jgi:hypothetical protein
MKPEEALAKRVIEAIEAGEGMIYREDQSIRPHDFDLHRKAGTVAAVEVTSVTDGVVKATHAAIDRCRRIPRIVCTKIGAFTRRQMPTSSASRRRRTPTWRTSKRVESTGSSARRMHRGRRQSRRSGATSACRVAESFLGRSRVSALHSR